MPLLGVSMLDSRMITPIEEQYDQDSSMDALVKR
jgi:hypothetical protein